MGKRFLPVSPLLLILTIPAFGPRPAFSRPDAAPPPHRLLLRANGAIEAFAAARARDDEASRAKALAEARAAAAVLADTHGYPLAAERLDAVEAWTAGQAADAVATWSRLERIEAESVRADPEASGAVLEECRALGDRWCEARALLARAEALNEASLPQQVRDDTAAAETIFRAAGPSERLGRTLMLRRGSGAGGGEAAIEAARDRYAEAILIAQQVGDPALEGRALCERVRLALDQKQMEEAAADLERMSEIAASGDFPRVAACGAYREGLLLQSRGDPAAARARWERGSESDARDRAPREALWNLIGVTAMALNAYDGAGALRWARESIALADRLHGTDDRGRAYCNYTIALLIQGMVGDVEPVARRCLELSRDNGSRRGEGIGLRGLGHAAQDRGEFDEALRLYGQSLAIAREIRNPLGGFWNLIAMGWTLRERGDLTAARDRFEKAREVADWLKWPDLQANARYEIALTLLQEGEIDAAAGTVEEAIGFVSSDRFFASLPWILRARGLIQLHRQNFTEALTDLRQAYQIFEKRGQPGSQTHIAVDIGNVYFRLFRLDRALVYYQRSLELAEQAGNTGTRLVALGNIALLKQRVQSYESAIDSHREVIREAKQAGRTSLVIHQTIQLADALSFLQRYEEAERQARAALALAEESNDPNGLIFARRSLARILSVRGRHREALALCRDNLSQASVADPHVWMDVRWTCGWVRLRAGQPARAADDFRSVIRIGEESRRRLGPTELGTTFLADRVAVYTDLVQALIETAGSDLSPGLIEEIFEISESFRARILLAALAPDSAPTDPGEIPEPAPGRESPARSDLLGRMAELHLLYSGGKVERERFLEAMRRLEDYLAEAGSPSGAATLLGAEAIDLATAQASIPDGRTAALEYLLGGESSFVLAVTRDRAIVARLEGNRREHFRTISRYRSLLESRGSQPDRDLEAIAILGRRMFRQLVTPALNALGPGIERLIIVADGPLYLLPFEALVVPDDPDRPVPRFLVEEFEVATIPSLSVLGQLDAGSGHSHSGRSLIALANPVLPDSAAGEAETGDLLRNALLPAALPPLPYSEEEVRNVARRLGGRKRILNGREATEANAREALQAGFPIVHFATHGFLDPHSIGRSGLVLTPDPQNGDDGLLQAREVIDLRADADLVVLSGCSTGVGRITGGEGALGLPHSLLQAGVPSVVQSLWEVRDRAAALFMDRFYAGLSEGMMLGEAMRSAKLDLLGSDRPELRHPSVWAPFVLSGVFDRRLDLPEPTLMERVPGGRFALLGVPIAFLAIGGLTWWGVRRRFRSG